MTGHHFHTDKELFNLIATGDHDAFTTFLERHRNNIFSHAMVFLKNAFEAQDVVQEVFLSLWKSRETLSTVDNPENYLFIMTRNRIVSGFRKKLPLQELDSIDQLQEAADPKPDHQLELKELGALIQLAVDHMPPQRKLVYELSKKRGLKHEEIAEQLNISPNTVKVHMVQALAFIRQFIRNWTIILVFYSLFRYFF